MLCELKADILWIGCYKLTFNAVYFEYFTRCWY